MAKPKYRWYIEPFGAGTNSVLAANCKDEDYCDQIECSDGKKRNLWICSEQIRNCMVRSRFRLNLGFRVFRMVLPNGKIRNVDFLFSSKKTKRKRLPA
jgi:hypothetical protein